ncbi:hypothetical protein GCM10027415_00580 [Humibacter ginsengisoli]
MTDQSAREARDRETRTDPHAEHKQCHDDECATSERDCDDPKKPEPAAGGVHEDRSSPPLSLTKTFPPHRVR